ncbi:MAG: hypothetical protein HY070_06700 [Chloroflexi bacterium]|nr:hypothetical protein [Chloroflexota bacterium]MBI3742165.1 hypothetical protein [Chloroflexota bacterium]
MNEKFVRFILSGLLVLVIAFGVGVYAYNAGIAQGVIDSGKLTAPVPNPYFGFGYHPFGFGAFGCFAPLLFLFLIFGLMRLVFFRGHYGWRGRMMHGEKDVPPMFEEWHKRAHETK